MTKVRKFIYSCATICTGIVLALVVSAMLSGSLLPTFAHGPSGPPPDDNTFLAHGPSGPPPDDGTLLAHGPSGPPPDDGTLLAHGPSGPPPDDGGDILL